MGHCQGPRSYRRLQQCQLNRASRHELCRYFVAAALLLNGETHQVYALRYKPMMHSSWKGTWLLKYEANDRTNKPRATWNNDKRLSLDWTGMVSKDVNLWLEGGDMSTDTNQIELATYKQRGIEYGAGLDWSLPKNWGLYCDYWGDHVNENDTYKRRPSRCRSFLQIRHQLHVGSGLRKNHRRFRSNRNVSELQKRSGIIEDRI